MKANPAWHPAVLLLALSGCILKPALVRQAARVESLERERVALRLKGLPVETASEYREELLREYGGFSRDITPASLKALRDGDLRSLFSAMGHVAFYTKEPDPAMSLGDVYDELASRGVAAPAQARKVYDELVVARLFDRARALARRRPDVDFTPLPAIVEPAEALAARQGRAYKVASDGMSLTLMTPLAAWGRGTNLVVSADPNCTPSGEIAKIEGDGELMRVFHERALILAGPQQVLESRSVAEWNRQHPGLKMYIAYRTSDWPEANLGETPVFNLFKDGKLAAQVVGYRPLAEKRAELLEKLRAVGIQPPSTP